MWDVAVIGGGPGGSAAAITAARTGLATVLFESGGYEGSRLGESLAPAAAPVLARLGVPPPVNPVALTSFGIESTWGGPELAANPFLFGPYGSGAHLDRKKFDATLADVARKAGAVVLPRTRVTNCEARPDGSWLLRFGPETAAAMAVIFATGRQAALARALGARRRAIDKLVGIAVEYAGAEPDGVTRIEACEDGWWYSAALPSNRRVVAFLTDPDICRSREHTTASGWARELAKTEHVGAGVPELTPLSRPRAASALSHRLDRSACPGRWLPVGDTALAVDPLSGSGLVRALLSGEAAGMAIAHLLLDRGAPADQYERWLDHCFSEYLRDRRAHYAIECRWPTAPFWRRRRSRIGLARRQGGRVEDFV